ncbi:uncharacterized protein LOC115388979 [Salarias fasciatus]|uniref:uncharacterized protein LOC115388979 n=1 Tax=Salarias fasciatus TaxID=181472 RepID=UPI0011770465|nr:uncharacterized protein LOC115388979 [Salarias fasciatus]
MKCSLFFEDNYSINLSCSDLLLHPVLSVSSSSSILGVSEAQQQVLQVVWGSTYTISCSIQPQYPGGSFQLIFTSSNTSYSSTQLAVNHSAHFLFPAAEPAHRGNYTCVYHLHVFGHNFWSESRLLSLSVSDPTAVIVRWVVVPLSLLLVQAALWLYFKVLFSSLLMLWSSGWSQTLLTPVCRHVSAGQQGADRQTGRTLSGVQWRDEVGPLNLPAVETRWFL